MNKKPYETQDVPIKPIAIGALIFVIIVAMTIYLLYEYTERVIDSSIHELSLIHI